MKELLSEEAAATGLRPPPPCDGQLLIKIPPIVLIMPRNNALYNNEGRGRFKDITRQVGLEVGASTRWKFSLDFRAIFPILSLIVSRKITSPHLLSLAERMVH